MSESRALVLVGNGLTCDAPMDRLALVMSDPMAMEVIGQRVMEGETLKRIARSWGVPVVRFVEWIAGDPGRQGQYEAALRVRADELALETVAIADEQAEIVKRNGESYDPDVPRDALRVSTRLKLAAFLDRERFGDTKARTATARVIVDRRCSTAQDGADRETVAVEISGG